MFLQDFFQTFVVLVSLSVLSPNFHWKLYWFCLGVFLFQTHLKHTYNFEHNIYTSLSEKKPRFWYSNQKFIIETLFKIFCIYDDWWRMFFFLKYTCMGLVMGWVFKSWVLEMALSYELNASWIRYFFIFHIDFRSQKNNNFRDSVHD